jgi:hypothetical protein
MRSLSRSKQARWAAAISVTALLGLASAAQASPLSTATVVGPARASAVAAVSSPSDTGASDVSNLGANGWAVQSSAVAAQGGA